MAGTASAMLSACGGGSGSASSGSGNAGTVPSAQNRFISTNLVASNASYQASLTLPAMVGAWGMAIRPAGAGGHFWLGAGGSSWEFIGDVKNHPDPALRSITTDGLKRVLVPATQGKPPVPGVTTGVAYNGAALTSNYFEPVFTDNSTTPPTQTRQVMTDAAGNPVTMQGSARFVFVTDSGYIAAWTDRRQDTGGILRTDGASLSVYDGTSAGSAFFGVAMKTDTWDTLWVADFGAKPQILQFDPQWALVPTQGFANPFATGVGGAAKPGDFVPFNITALGSRVFVSYAKSRVDANDPNAFFAGEEDSMEADPEKASGYQPDRGRLVEYTLTGAVVRIYNDDKRLNAPWGVAIAPASFGAFAGAVLVANFGGAGYIAAFDGNTGAFTGYLRNVDNTFVAVAGIWSLQFGNGVSLGDSDALYFGAGPEGSAPAGLFGSLRYAPT